VVWVVAILSMRLGIETIQSFGVGTCGNSPEDVKAFLEEWNDQSITVVKTGQEGRIQAVLYENQQGKLGVNIFERRLFGLRLKHDGMNLYDEDGKLYLTGSWTEGGLKGSRCDIVVCGDNRGGEVLSYTVSDASDKARVTREYVNAGYILDIYILDGIDTLPKNLHQEIAG